MQRWLQLTDFGPVLLRRSPGFQTSLFTLVKKQMHNHLETMQSNSFRRKDLIQTFSQSVKTMETIDPNNIKEIQKWTEETQSDLSQKFDQFVSDFNPNKALKLPFNLNKSINLLCEQSFHTQVCLNFLLLDNDNHTEIFQGKNFKIQDCFQRATESVSSLATEKFGNIPHIKFEGETKNFGSEIFFCPSLLQFTVIEILKNSIKAMIDRYGVSEIDKEESINIVFGDGFFVIEDTGKGMSEEVKGRLFDAFFTGEEEDQKEINYFYSGEFGVKFCGAGFGVLKSKVYLEFHGFGIDVQSREGEGTKFKITL